MSGVTLTPLQIERNRINRLQGELAQQNKRNSKLKEELVKQGKNWTQSLSSVQSLIKDQQNKHQEGLQHLKSDLKVIEQRHQNHLQAIDRSFRTALANQKNDLEKKYMKLKNGLWNNCLINEMNILQSLTSNRHNFKLLMRI